MAGRDSVIPSSVISQQSVEGMNFSYQNGNVIDGQTGGNQETELIIPEILTRLCPLSVRLPYRLHLLPTMSQEPVHGNLSHAMRDNYAEHGVDQVRPIPVQPYEI